MHRINRKRLALAVLLIALLAYAGCSNPQASPATSSTTQPSATSTTPPDTAATTQVPVNLPSGNSPWLPSDAVSDVPASLPVSAAIQRGTLANGLSYYLKPNSNPSGKVTLSLVVKAGSAHEREDQLGLAHFLEHMMFNGTEKYPKNELSEFLGSLGLDIGADINAYTAYESTVYNLSLPNTDPELIATALDVLVQWAAHATLLPADVEAEKGIVAAEWRQVDDTGHTSLEAGIDATVLAGTPYHNRHPGATLQAIDRTTAAGLREFYETWYQPANMAVVVVGDIAEANIEPVIEAKFAGLQAKRELPPDPIAQAAPYQPVEAPAVAVKTTANTSESKANLFFPRPAAAPNTSAKVLDDMVAELVFAMLRTRLSGDVSNGDNPAREISDQVVPIASQISIPHLQIIAGADDLGQSLELTVAEIERANRYGFGQQEFEQARKNLQASFDALRTELAAAENWQVADELGFHYSAGEAAMDNEQAYAIFTKILAQITPAMAQYWLQQQLEFATPSVVVIGPDEQAGDLPTQDWIAQLISNTAVLDLKPRETNAAPTADRLMEPPEPAKVAATRELPHGITELTLANGVRVLHIENDASPGNVSFSAVSPGGESQLEPDELIGLGIPTSALASSGVGELSVEQYQNFLADKTLEIEPFLSQISEGFNGSAASQDFEHLLAYVHLTMTQPKVDPTALEALLTTIREYWTSANLPSINRVHREFFQARYGDSPYFSIAAQLASLEGVTAADVTKLLQDRFANAADFVFAIAGDISLERAQELAQRYLGTLPATAERETWREIVQPPPTEAIERTVNVESDDTGQLLLHFITATTDADSTAKQLRAELLREIVETRLFSLVREQLSATYYPIVRLRLASEPRSEFDAQVQFEAEPDRVAEIAKIVLAELTELSNTITTEEFTAAKEKLARNKPASATDNQTLVNLLLTVADDADPAAKLADHFGMAELLEAIDYDSIKALAAEVYPADQYILVTAQSQ